MNDNSVAHFEDDPGNEDKFSLISFSDLESSTPPKKSSELYDLEDITVHVFNDPQVSHSDPSLSSSLDLSNLDLSSMGGLTNSLQDISDSSEYVQQPDLPPLPTLKELGLFPPLPKTPLPGALPGVALDQLSRLVSNEAGRLQIKRPDFVVYRLHRCLLVCENKLRIRAAAVRQLKGYMTDLRSSNPYALGMALEWPVLEESMVWKWHCSNGSIQMNQTWSQTPLPGLVGTGLGIGETLIQCFSS